MPGNEIDVNAKHQFCGRAFIRLTMHTDFALRILLHAALRPAQRLGIAKVAEVEGISRNHAMKVVNTLAANGLLDTVRGRGGGFSLARPAEAITIGEVVRLTEPDLQPADCANCSMRSGCGLSPILSGAVKAFLDELDGYTLADAAQTSRTPVLPLQSPRGPTWGRS